MLLNAHVLICHATAHRIARPSGDAVRGAVLLLWTGARRSQQQGSGRGALQQLSSGQWIGAGVMRVGGDDEMMKNMFLAHHNAATPPPHVRAAASAAVGSAGSSHATFHAAQAAAAPASSSTCEPAA